MVAIPTLILALVCLVGGRLRNPLIPLGLLLSAVGDAAGAMGLFGVQLGAFALALSCYTAAFVPHCRLRHRGLWLLAVLLLGCGVALSLGLRQRVPTVEAVAVGAYAVVLLSMLFAALLQRRKGRGWYVAAALLFMLSDSLIGYSRYIAPLPVADWWILPPYYAAQLIFAVQNLRNSRFTIHNSQLFL